MVSSCSNFSTSCLVNSVISTICSMDIFELYIFFAAIALYNSRIDFLNCDKSKSLKYREHQNSNNTNRCDILDHNKE